MNLFTGKITDTDNRKTLNIGPDIRSTTGVGCEVLRSYICVCVCIYISFRLGRAVAGCFLTILLPMPSIYAILQVNLPSLRLLVCLHLLLSHVTMMSQNAESFHLLFLQSGSHGAQT